MPNSTPVRIGVPAASTYRERRHVIARRRMEDGLLVETLRGQFDREAARIQAEAVGEAVKFNLAVELDVLAYGIEGAGNSAAAAKIVGDHVELLSRLGSANLMRRFG